MNRTMTDLECCRDEIETGNGKVGECGEGDGTEDSSAGYVLFGNESFLLILFKSLLTVPLFVYRAEAAVGKVYLQ